MPRPSTAKPLLTGSRSRPSGSVRTLNDERTSKDNRSRYQAWRQGHSRTGPHNVSVGNAYMTTTSRSLTALVFGICILSVPQVVSNRGLDDWPQWRGRNRDGISAEKGLLKAWPQGG